MHPFITVSLKMMKKESPKMAFADITGAKVELHTEFGTHWRS